MSRLQHFHDARFATGSLPTASRRLFLLTGLLAFGASLPIFPASATAQTTATETRPAVDPYSAYVAEASRRFGLPEHWIRAVMTAESDGIARAVSSKGATGLMQIMPDTWIELRARYRLGNDPFDPRDNILAGAAYLRELHDQYGSRASSPPTMPDRAATKSISSTGVRCRPKRATMLRFSCSMLTPPPLLLRQSPCRSTAATGHIHRSSSRKPTAVPTQFRWARR